MKCDFCKLDISKIENIYIEETANFLVKPSLGSLVRGYLLIIPKRHIINMSQLNDSEMVEYKTLIKKYRMLFYEIYHKYPLFFEHGSGIDNTSSASIVHAHLHIVNYNFLDEKEIISKLNMNKIVDFKGLERSYIYYISADNKEYITFNYNKKSQLMRYLIAKDLKMPQKYNWKLYSFYHNIEKTLKDFKGF